VHAFGALSLFTINGCESLFVDLFLYFLVIKEVVKRDAYNNQCNNRPLPSNKHSSYLISFVKGMFGTRYTGLLSCHHRGLGTRPRDVGLLYHTELLLLVYDNIRLNFSKPSLHYFSLTTKKNLV
jgi:hypothetical protein